MPDTLSRSLAAAVRAARMARELSTGALAERAGVSRTMIAKIERGAAQPTASLLGRLAAALGMTLSELVARAEGPPRRLVRAAEQPTWTDPGTGYRRRALSPASGGPLELVEIELPPGAEVFLTAGNSAFLHEQIWMLDGRLQLCEDDDEYELAAGDCLQLGPATQRRFVNPADLPCRYLVALTKRSW